MALYSHHKLIFILLNFIFISPVIATGLKIDKVYHPYVQPLEREIEWRAISADGDQKHRLGLGKSFSDRLFVEGYLIAKDVDNNFHLDAYELEVKWQLTEQGEYAIDWGIIAELEKVHDVNAWEFKTGLLIEKEWGKWTGRANIWGIYEWGEKVEDELESALALQTRYRYSRYFEPALELYSGQDTLGLGPVAMGEFKAGKGKKLHWEIGAIFGLDDTTPDTTWRFLTEFEF